MAKRGAVRQLTQDNWEEEDEEETAGHFKVASTEDLSKRKIIKAKRRVNSSENKGASVFQGFSGFSGLSNNAKSSGATTMKPFTGITSLTSGVKSTSTETAASTASPHSVLASKVDNQNGASGLSSVASSVSKGVSGSNYNDNIKALNESVAAWIEKHIKLNPFVDLTPIFNDYKEHMKNIDQKFSTSATDSLPSSSLSVETSSAKQPATVQVSTSLFGASSTQPSTSLFTALNAKPQGSQEQEAGITTSLNTGSGMATGVSEPSTSGEANEEDQAPKPEKVVGPEAGAFHSTRCKLFFKREGSWNELGIGMLNLKKLETKTQVLVRNNTALGKILLNVYLSQSTPISRSGKNNVILVSVPNPPLYSKASEGDNSKPATYLIKVKTAENADELYSKLESSKSPEA